MLYLLLAFGKQNSQYNNCELHWCRRKFLSTDIGDTAKRLAAKRGANPRGTYDLMAAPLGPQCRTLLHSPQPDQLLSVLRPPPQR